jgi:glycosyltransferase involved in cell wall biosynthesis
MAERGHDVHVFTPSWPGDVIDPPGVTVHRLRPLARSGNAAFVPQLMRLPKNAIAHLHYPFYGGSEFVALSGRPYIATYHQDVEIDGWKGRMATMLDRSLGRLILRRAARLCPTTLDYLATSPFGHLVEELGDRVVPVPNGVDTDVFAPGPRDPELIAELGLGPKSAIGLFVGSMDSAHHFKGVGILLEALRQAPGASIVLIGEGDLRRTYQDLADRYLLEGRVRFLGRVDASRLPALYRSSDFLVLPSETRGEAFGVVLLEAMASGKPVIATRLPGVREVVNDGVDGLLVPPSDAASLARAIQALIAMPEPMRAELGAAGRRKVEQRYGWDQIGDQLESIYQEVWSEREGRRRWHSLATH